MGWETSDRGDRLPRDWRKRRAAVLRRDGYRCTWVADGYRCPVAHPQGRGLQVDHIDRNGGDAPANLRTLCEPHHQAKTIAEREAARPSRYRPPGVHPGLRR